MTSNRFKHIALGIAAYAGAMYLLKFSNAKLDGFIDETFSKWIK